MNFRSALFIMLVLLVLAGIHLFIYAQNISLNYQVTDLKVKLSELKSRDRMLGSQAARAENLGYVEKTAREKLGMIYPEKINYIIGGTIARRSAEATGEANLKRN